MSYLVRRAVPISFIIHRSLRCHLRYSSYSICLSLRTTDNGCNPLQLCHQKLFHNLEKAKGIRMMSSESAIEIKEVTFVELKKMMDDDRATLIDVREPDELKNDGKILDAINIPLDTLEEAFRLSPAKFQEKYGVIMPGKEENALVLSCKSGKRAAKAYVKLMPLEIKNILVYSGSFLDWIDNKGPLEKP